MLLSTGAGADFTLIDVSNAIAGQTASNISFTAAGNISATDVQAALQELDTEKIGSASPTFTGTVLLGQNAVLAFEGSAADDYETTITVTNPTADRSIVFPDVKRERRNDWRYGHSHQHHDSGWHDCQRRHQHKLRLQSASSPTAVLVNCCKPLLTALTLSSPAMSMSLERWTLRVLRRLIQPQRLQVLRRSTPIS